MVRILSNSYNGFSRFEMKKEKKEKGLRIQGLRECSSDVEVSRAAPRLTIWAPRVPGKEEVPPVGGDVI